MNKLKILIVEDEILIADAIKRFLTNKGFEVVGMASSYEEAVQLFVRERPDIALLDIHLKGRKAGIDFAHFIRRQAAELLCPFIYVTSQHDSETINRAKQTFPAGYLSKPVRMESLYSTIEIAIHSHLAKKKELETLSIFDGTHNHLVPIRDLLYLQADHVYVKFNLKSEKVIVQRNSLKDILKQLPPNQFIRTHRSFAINTREVNRWDKQYIYIHNKAIPLSRSRRKEVLSSLSY